MGVTGRISRVPPWCRVWTAAFRPVPGVLLQADGLEHPGRRISARDPVPHAEPLGGRDLPDATGPGTVRQGRYVGDSPVQVAVREQFLAGALVVDRHPHAQAGGKLQARPQPVPQHHVRRHEHEALDSRGLASFDHRLDRRGHHGCLQRSQGGDDRVGAPGGLGDDGGVGDVADEDLQAGPRRQRVGPAHDGVDRVARFEHLPDHLHACLAVSTENGDDHRFSPNLPWRLT
jgi:hypothetical protein